MNPYSLALYSNKAYPLSYNLKRILNSVTPFRGLGRRPEEALFNGLMNFNGRIVVESWNGDL